MRKATPEFSNDSMMNTCAGKKQAEQGHTCPYQFIGIKSLTKCTWEFQENPGTFLVVLAIGSAVVPMPGLTTYLLQELNAGTVDMQR